MPEQPRGIGEFTVLLETSANDNAGTSDGGDAAEAKAASSKNKKEPLRATPESRNVDDLPNARFVPPVLNPRITSPFGPRIDPVTGTGTEMHRGIDFAGKVGDPIYAVADGTVAIAGPVPGFGNHAVYIEHVMDGKKFYSVYGHGSSLSVRAGQQVKAGDKVASIGAEGHVSGPHLHFEIQETINGKRLDPTSLFGSASV